MRIFSRLNIGGPSIHIVLLSAGLGSRGYETRLVVGQEGEREGNLFDLAASHHVTCHRLPGLGREVHPVTDLKVLRRLYAAMREFRPSIVHTHAAKAGFVGRIAAILAGVPVIVHTFHGHVLRGYFGAAKTMLYRLLERWLARRSSLLIAVSAAVRDDLVALGVAEPGKIRVVPLGLQLQDLSGPLPKGRLRDTFEVPAGVPLVGIVGRLVPIKDVATFLEAAALVRQRRPEVHFAVVGDGELRADLERRAVVSGLGPFVHFYGWRRDMAEVYGDLDIVVNCSRNEGTPVALIEALAASRPVIATRVGGTPDLLGDGARGVLVPPGDASALAQAIVRGIEAPEEARRQAVEGRAYVLAQHSVDRLLSDVDTLYRELLARTVAA